MKKLAFLIGFAILTLVGTYVVSDKAEAGAKRMKKINEVITASATDSTRWTQTTQNVVIAFPNQTENVSYDKLFGTVIFSDFTALSDSALGNRDTGFAVIFTGADNMRDTIYSGNCTPPCTLEVDYDQIYGNKGDTSGAGAWMHSYSRHALYLENLFVTLTLADSARVGIADSTETATIQYNLRLIEE